MDEHRKSRRTRSLRRARIWFNSKSSLIDCVVRNLSEGGALLHVHNTVGIPDSFDLQIEGEKSSRPSRTAWKANGRVGVSFAQTSDLMPERTGPMQERTPNREILPAAASAEAKMLRGELLTLRAALDDVPFGIVFLDSEMRARFINRCFRRMWRLPDANADADPAFVALIHHGCQTLSYDVPRDKFAQYVEARVAHVRSGDPKPIDIRLVNGEVIRLHSTVLPAGGRLLSYHYVTDIVKHSDELEILRAALDEISQGIILLDRNLIAQFMNKAVRRLWKVSDAQADAKPFYATLVQDSRKTLTYAVAPENLSQYIADRITRIRSGDQVPYDITLSDGRTIRTLCTVLPGDGRMLTYTDITDLVRDVQQQRHIATVDELTGIYNRRHFLEVGGQEWSRFQRYHRPLSVLTLDLDHFKSINDRYGHEAGDQALRHVAELCTQAKRLSDLLARLGGDEFAILLPETDLEQALVIGERLRRAVEQHPLLLGGNPVALSVSIGVAGATESMSGLGALMAVADQLLYKAKSDGRNRIAKPASNSFHSIAQAAE